MKSLIYLSAVLVQLFCATHPLKAQEESKPWIATVDMQVLVQGYYKMAEVQKEHIEHNVTKRKVSDERIAGIRDIKKEFSNLSKQLEVPTLPDTEKLAISKKLLALDKELTSLDMELREMAKQMEQQHLEKVKQLMHGIVTKLINTAEAHAKTGNYDYVCSDWLSIAGSEGSNFLAYTGDNGNATPIADLILKEVNKDAPADFQPRKDSKPAASQLATSNRERNAASPQPKLRIAKVDMAKLHGMYYKTSEIDKKMDQVRAKIELHKTRLSEIEKAEGEVQKQLNDPTLRQSDKVAKYKNLLTLRQEAATTRRLLPEQIGILDGASRLRMKSFTDEIQKIVIERCKADGFDFVADSIVEKTISDGSLIIGPSFLISTAPTADGFGPMTDVTNIMLQQINKNAPAGFQVPR